MIELYVAMRWKDKMWEPLCGPVELETAEAFLTDDISMIFEASSDATHFAQNGQKGNDND